MRLNRTTTASMLETYRLVRREDDLRGVSAGTKARTLAGALRAEQQLASADRLHLGCGDHLLDGWANVDLLAFPGVVPWNLKVPLPVVDGSVSFVFSEHFIEHVSLEDGRRWFRDCARVLEPGGVLRVSTPDLRYLVDSYQEGRIGEWADVDWTPSTPCQLLNEGMHSWGHLFLYDFDEMKAQLHTAGFTKVERVAWRESRHPELRGLELRPFHGEVIVEATR